MWRDHSPPPTRRTKRRARERGRRPSGPLRGAEGVAARDGPGEDAGQDCVVALRELGEQWSRREEEADAEARGRVDRAQEAADGAPSGRAGALARLTVQFEKGSLSRRSSARARAARVHDHELGRFLARAAGGARKRTVERDENSLTRRRLPFDDRVARARDAPLAVVALEEYALRWWGRCPEHRVVEDDACTACGGAVALVEPYGLEACCSCGRMRRRADSTVASVAASATQAPTLDWRVFCYSRVHYAEHLLRQLQARGNASVPEEVVKDVGKEIAAGGGDPTSATVHEVEAAMRRLTRARRSKGETLQPYYESAALVCCKLSGLAPFRMTRAMERAVLTRFREASACFDRLSRKDETMQRKNMTNYSFALRRIADHLSEEFPEMTRFTTEVLANEGRDRARVNAKLWSRICEQLGWPDNSDLGERRGRKRPN